MSDNSISNLVRSIKALGLNQSQIAKETGITQATISRIESGKHPDPRYSTVAALIELRERLTK